MNVSRLYNTIKHLRFEQLYYRAYYKIKHRFYSYPAVAKNVIEAANAFPVIKFPNGNAAGKYEPKGQRFTFLNKTHAFGSSIDWNYNGEGKLWTYNLNYFEWLDDESLAFDERFATIIDYCNKDGELKDGTEPYPTSIRGINWIKFLSANAIKNEQVNNCLYRHYHKLAAFPEYQLLANHLLENGFSLFFAAYYFYDAHFHKLSIKLLHNGLEEQVLPDGGHYELSPMYHCIILQRLLDCILLAEQCARFSNDKPLLQLMRSKAALMCGWLKAFMYRDGSYALFGDAAPGISLNPQQLLNYAEELNIQVPIIKLNESGYRKICSERYELIVDAGNIGPSYQAGHAHADSLSFCLHVDNKPVIVDTGISTYERNERRMHERGTSAHNTIVVNDMNSSDVWAAFRTAARATVTIIEEGEHSICASHDGYHSQGITHRRCIKGDNLKIIIEDSLEHYKEQEAILYLHFHPDIKAVHSGPDQFTAGNIRITVSGAYSMALHNYLYCEGYNRLAGAQCLQAHVKEHAMVVIELISYAG